MPTDDLVSRLRATGCVFAEAEAEVLLEAAAGDPVRLDRLLEQRVAGRPLEHVVGWADVAGVRVQVDDGVFVPRQRSAFLVDLAVEAAPPGGVLVDLCCGSGALAAATLARRADLTVHAADVDPRATACAARNLPSGAVSTGDLFDPLPADLRGRVDVLLVNAPYVPTERIEEMPPEARDHEWLGALDGGHDGLEVHRRVAAQAAGWLGTGGVLLIEVAPSQAPVALALLAAAGLRGEVLTDDDRGATAVRARRADRPTAG